MIEKQCRRMKIKLSDHAQKQRIERKIPLKDILQTVKNPESKARSFKKRQLLQREFGGKILEVVNVTEKGIITVIIQYYLEKEEL